MTRASTAVLFVVSVAVALAAAGCEPEGGGCALERCEPWICGDPRPECPCSELCERPACGGVAVYARDPETGACLELDTACDVPDGWEYFFAAGECEAGQSMCLSDDDCGDGERCDVRSCALDATGACVPAPDACADAAGEPVIGCDGVVYASDCERLLEGVGYAGQAEVGVECPPGGVWARDPESGACGYYASTCYVPDGWDYFVSRDACAGPECSTEPVWVFDPIAGECVEYENDCAVPTGVEFFVSELACPVIVSGSCSSGADCADGQACDVQSCGGADAGTCVALPAGCAATEGTEDDVCGCSGVTYASDCERLLAGDALAYRGACAVAS
jgi:hypothetical protein